MLTKLFTFSLILFFLVGARASNATTDDEAKNLYQFKSIIQCYQPHLGLTDIANLADYGCWCGKGGRGITVDETDECCKTHDNCYGQAGKLAGNFYLFDLTYTETYAWQCDNKTATCSGDKNTEFEQAVCECDLKAAECFKEKRPTFNLDNHDIDWEACCETSPPTSECKHKQWQPKETEEDANVEDEGVSKEELEETQLVGNANVAPETLNEVEDNNPNSSDQVEDSDDDSKDASDSSEQKSATSSVHGNFAQKMFAFFCMMALVV